MNARAALIPGLAALALVACQREAAEEAPDAAAPAATAGPAADAGDAGAATATLPRLRAGLWRVEMTAEGMPTPMVTRMCLDDAIQAEMNVIGQSDPRCRQTRMARGADGSWSFASTCDMDSAGRTSVEGRVTGDFQTRYETRMTSTTTGAQLEQMNRETTISSVSAWQGPCPAGWAAGDIETPAGRMNMAEVRREAEAGARGQ